MAHPFNIFDHFSAAVKKNPDKAALIYKGNTISFAAFERQIEESAYYFLDRGIKKGSRVLVFIPMSPDLYRIVLALFKIGATAVFLDEWVSKKRMEACCEVVHPDAFIGTFKARILSVFSSALRRIPIRLGINYRSGRPRMQMEATSKEDTALITFTTGSTGIPKAAKRTHGFLEAQFNALLGKISPVEDDDIDMPVLPIVLLLNLATGVTSVIAEFNAAKPATLAPKKIIGQIRTYGVNRIIASPFFIKKISRYIIEKNIALPQIKKILTGGAPVFSAEAGIYLKAFPDTFIEVIYGSTEAEPISSLNIREESLGNQKNFEKALNAGRPDECAEVSIIRITDKNISVTSEENFKNLELPIGQIGEITVSGNHVLTEYLNNEEALKRNKIFIGQKCRHRTGDSGYLNEDGFLFLTGRCSTLIYLDNKIIAPFVYENFFQTIKGVEAGTVLMLKNKLIAVAELNAGGNKKHISEKINSAEIIFDEIIFIKKIPRDPRHNSKIDYEKLVTAVSRKV